MIFELGLTASHKCVKMHKHYPHSMNGRKLGSAMSKVAAQEKPFAELVAEAIPDHLVDECNAFFQKHEIYDACHGLSLTDGQLSSMGMGDNLLQSFRHLRQFICHLYLVDVQDAAHAPDGEADLLETAGTYLSLKRACNSLSFRCAMLFDEAGDLLEIVDLPKGKDDAVDIVSAALYHPDCVSCLTGQTHGKPDDAWLQGLQDALNEADINSFGFAAGKMYEPPTPAPNQNRNRSLEAGRSSAA